MGIKGLWGVLTPFSEKKSLHEIRGETIAIDLSGWVCDSQNVTDFHIQPKLYLRNLFFRTVYLLMADIKPIFVLEGDAPDLKRDVIAARNATQFKGATNSDDKAKKKPNISRSRFRNVLKECESLLTCMGVSCIKAMGEAEATCAVLNTRGVVDAVVSQDSDCFAYGARRVYRNFSVSSAAGAGAMQGSIDCYDADQMISHNGFGRNKMVSLALLCGCDYGPGVCGTATTTVISFLNTVDEQDAINRLLSWVNEPEKYEEYQHMINSGCCDRCGHPGRTHGKKGCPICMTKHSCNDYGHKAKMSEIKKELSLRTKALASGIPFPETKIISEFLENSSQNIKIDKSKVAAPSLIQFVKLMRVKLEWSERYSFEKFLPVLTRWHLQSDVTNRSLQPRTIIKKRNPKGVPSYEVVWSDVNGRYTGLIPDEQYEDTEDPSVSWTTIERQDLMSKYYPEVVNMYEESIKKPPKEKKTRARKKKDEKHSEEKPKRKYAKKKDKEIIKSLTKSLINLSTSRNKANVSVKVNKLKRQRKSNNKNQKTLHSFISKRKKSMKNLMESLRQSFTHISLNDSVILKDVEANKENSFNLLDLSNDDCPESDLSDIVDKIIRNAPSTKTASVNNKLVRLVFDKRNTPTKSGFRKTILNQIHFDSSTPNSSPARMKTSCKTADVSNYQASTSLFFDKLTDECDAFEMSIDYNYVSDCDKTVSYNLSELPPILL